MVKNNSDVAEVLERAESDYLFDRIASLAKISGNPYKASIFDDGPYKSFFLATNASPMNNRLCGFDIKSQGLPDKIITRFEQAGTTVHVPVIGEPKLLKEAAKAFGAAPLRGWTHGQFWANLEDLADDEAAGRARRLDSAEMNTFVTIHAAAFRSGNSQSVMARDMFQGLLEDGRAEAYAVEIDDTPVAIGLVYFAKNKTAYLATSATTRATRKKGAHSALIARRIAAARERGAVRVSATALLNSQSRRNLQRAGLSLSHVQTLLALC